MSRETSATATENLVYSNLLVISALKNSTFEKKTKVTLLFLSLMNVDNKVIYGLCRRYMLI